MYVKILPIYLSVCFIGIDPHKVILSTSRLPKISLYVWAVSFTTQTVDQYRMNMLSIDRLYFMKVLVCQVRSK